MNTNTNTINLNTITRTYLRGTKEYTAAVTELAKKDVNDRIDMFEQAFHDANLDAKYTGHRGYDNFLAHGTEAEHKRVTDRMNDSEYFARAYTDKPSEFFVLLSTFRGKEIALSGPLDCTLEEARKQARYMRDVCGHAGLKLAKWKGDDLRWRAEGHAVVWEVAQSGN